MEKNKQNQSGSNSVVNQNAQQTGADCTNTTASKKKAKNGFASNSSSNSTSNSNSNSY